jgi:hypothetical protein
MSSDIDFARDLAPRPLCWLWLRLWLCVVLLFQKVKAEFVVSTVPVAPLASPTCMSTTAHNVGGTATSTVPVPRKASVQSSLKSFWTIKTSTLAPPSHTAAALPVPTPEDHVQAQTAIVAVAATVCPMTAVSDMSVPMALSSSSPTPAVPAIATSSSLSPSFPTSSSYSSDVSASVSVSSSSSAPCTSDCQATPRPVSSSTAVSVSPSATGRILCFQAAHVTSHTWVRHCHTRDASFVHARALACSHC